MASKSGAAPQAWLIDRTNGQSKYNDGERPPAPCCWVSPCVGWCPGLLETNFLCRMFGNCGFSDAEVFRFVCLHVGFMANVCAMIGTAYAALSISQEYFLLSKAPMELVEIRDTNGNLGETITLFLGLRGVAFDKPSMATSVLGRQFVVLYDDLCSVFESDNLIFDQSKDCDGCSTDYFSMNAVISLMISVTLFFPTFFSQQLRMYSGYDVNCVKNFLSVMGICIVLLNLNVMLTYFFLCSKETFYEEKNVYFDSEAELSSDADAYYALEYTWRWGWGLISLIAGTGLKVIDLMCNVAVPTPKVTRDRREQEIYETIMYADDKSAVVESADEESADEESAKASSRASSRASSNKESSKRESAKEESAIEESADEYSVDDKAGTDDYEYVEENVSDDERQNQQYNQQN